MNKSVWEETVGKNANKKIVGSHDRCKGGVYTIERESIPFVKRRERGGKRICERAVEERIHLAIKVTTNGTGVLCRKEGWEETDGAEL